MQARRLKQHMDLAACTLPTRFMFVSRILFDGKKYPPLYIHLPEIYDLN